MIFGIRSWNHDPLDYTVEGADARSFRSLNDGYALDKYHVYLEGDRIENADPSTFTILKDGYSKDKNHIFLRTCALKGADPGTWSLIAEYWSRDANRVYQGYWNIPGAKPATFRYIRDCWAIDDARAYHHITSYPADCSVPLTNPFNRLTIFNDVDVATFDVIDSFRARYARQLFDALNGTVELSQKK